MKEIPLLRHVFGSLVAVTANDSLGHLGRVMHVIPYACYLLPSSSSHIFFDCRGTVLVSFYSLSQFIVKLSSGKLVYFLYSIRLLFKSS